MFTDLLIEEAKKGSSTALNKLIALWQKRIYNFCYKYFLNHDMAMETTQKTFISLYHNISGLKETSSFKYWLYRIAANHCKEELRKSKRSWVISIFGRSNDTEDSVQSENFSFVASRENDPQNAYLQGELSNLLEKALSLLSEEQRVVVIMKEYEGFKFTEIAEILGIRESTAKSRLYYGLENLKKILNKWNINKETVSYGI